MVFNSPGVVKSAAGTYSTHPLKSLSEEVDSDKTDDVSVVWENDDDDLLLLLLMWRFRLCLRIL